MIPADKHSADLLLQGLLLYSSQIACVCQTVRCAFKRSSPKAAIPWQGLVVMQPCGTDNVNMGMHDHLALHHPHTCMVIANSSSWCSLGCIGT